MSDEDIKVKFGGDTSELKKETQAAAAMVKGMSGHMSEGFAHLRAELTRFLGVAAVVASMRHAVKETVDFDVQAMKLARTLGITTEAASSLDTALGNINSNAGQFTAAANMLNQQLRLNEQGFNDLGIKTRDSSGNLRNLLDIMLDANKRILNFKEGVDRNIISQRLYSRGWKEVAETLSLTKDGMAEAAKRNEELGLTVGPEQVAKTNAYRGAMNDAGDVLKGMAVAAGRELMPVLTILARWFSDNGPTAISIARGAIQILVATFMGLKIVVEGLILAIKSLWNILVAALDTVFTGLSGIMKIFDALMHGEIGKAKTEVMQLGTDIEAHWSKAFDQIQADAAETGKVIAPLLDGSGGGYLNKPGVMPAGVKAGGPGAAKGGTEHAGDEVTAKQKEIAIKMTRDAELARLEEAKRGLEMRRALDQQDAIDQIQQLKTIEDQKYVIQQQALMARYQLYQFDKDKRKEIEAEIDQMNRQRIANNAQMERQAVVDTQKRYQQMISGATNALTSGLQQMIRGTMTFRQMMANIGMAVVDEFIAQGVRMVVSWATAEVAKTTASAAGAETRTTIETAAAGESVLLTAATSVKEIIMSAWVAAANVYKAIAAIPFVGPFLAPAMAIGAVAAVMGFAKNIASAAGGWVVPEDQMAQVHKNEMILPAHLSDRIRNMTEPGKGKGGEGGDVHYHVSAIDAAGVARWFKQNGRAAAAALRYQRKQFTPVTG